ncbi:hypothetical protein B0A53_05522 [Rhodotorula sp. CCFEE 5036]|nr:hypothetical protein B0A53_05522 [Rhodotorula sp. CCFEE 5036]
MVQMIMSTAEGAGGAAVNDRSMDDYAAAIRFGHQCTTELWVRWFDWCGSRCLECTWTVR